MCGWIGRVRLRLISSLLCGKVTSQLFEDLPESIKNEWVNLLTCKGRECTPCKGDRRSDVDLRLLKALAESVGDPDTGYLGEMAGVGVVGDRG